MLTFTKIFFEKSWDTDINKNCRYEHGPNAGVCEHGESSNHNDSTTGHHSGVCVLLHRRHACRPWLLPLPGGHFAHHAHLLVSYEPSQPLHAVTHPLSGTYTIFFSMNN